MENIQQASIQKITENIFAISVFNYNSLVVVGDQGVLIVDPANSYRAKLLKNEIKKITNLSVSHIVLSHEHYDHVGGTEIFPDTQIYAQSNARSIFKLDILGVVPKKIHKWFDTEATIWMGNIRVDLHHYGAGDGVASSIVHLPNEKVVYCVDMFDAGALSAGKWLEDSNSLGVRLILNELVHLNPDYVVNGHTTDLNPIHLKRASQFYNDLYDAVAPKMIEATQKGFPEIMKTIETLPKTVKLDKYKDLKYYEDLPVYVHRMAMVIFHGG